jgi:hypothetical protein
MKRVFLLSIAVMVMSCLVLAQAKPQQAKKPQAPDFAKRAAKVTEKLNKQLNLSKAANDSLKKILTSYFVETRRINTVVLKQKQDENFKKHDARVKKVLTPEQYKKYSVMMAKQRKAAETKNKQAKNGKGANAGEAKNPK